MKKSFKAIEIRKLTQFIMSKNKAVKVVSLDSVTN